MRKRHTGLGVAPSFREIMNDPYHSETHRDIRLEQPVEFAAATAMVAGVVTLIVLVVVLWKHRKKKN